MGAKEELPKRASQTIVYVKTDQTHNNAEIRQAIQTCQVQKATGEYYLWGLTDPSSDQLEGMDQPSQRSVARMKLICGLIASSHGGESIRNTAITIGRKQFFSNSPAVIRKLEEERDRRIVMSRVCKTSEWAKRRGWADAVKAVSYTHLTLPTILLV